MTRMVHTFDAAKMDNLGLIETSGALRICDRQKQSFEMDRFRVYLLK